MTERSDGALFVLCVALQGCIVGGLALAARSGCASSTIAFGLALCFLPYAGAIHFSRSLPSKRALSWVAIGLALAFGAACVFML